MEDTASPRNEVEMNRVRIFISSPGDVAEERNRAQAVVERL
ncbi:MAG: hypothetical protein ACI9UU_003429 [Candidatus Azotimanducaceae bacterium]|jgi:hypothetical protein